MSMVILDGNSLSIGDLVSVSRKFSGAALSHKISKKIKVNRPLGGRKDQNTISNAFHKHACGERRLGIGDYISLDIIRGAMLLKANELSRGLSGTSDRTIKCLLDLLNRRIHPAIPVTCPVGIYGESGYLSYLTELLDNGSESPMHVLLVKDPEQDVTPEVLPAREVWKMLEPEQFELEKKDRFAISTGNCINVAAAGLLLHDAENLTLISEAAAVMSMEAIKTNRESFHKKIQGMRGDRGQSETAKFIRNLTMESQLVSRKSHVDPSSLRCVPQTAGALRTLTSLIHGVFTHDLNAITLGSAFISDQKKGILFLSGGNYHSLPMALIIDFLKEGIAVSGALSERRLFRLLNPKLSNGLPPNLVKDTNVHNGISRYRSVAAGLMAENRILAQPGVLNSVATYEDENDFNPNCLQAALDGFKLVKNVKKVIAMEFLAACRGIDLRKEGIYFNQLTGISKTKPLFPGLGTTRIHEWIRSKIPGGDRPGSLTRDLKSMEELIQSKGLLNLLKTF